MTAQIIDLASRLPKHERNQEETDAIERSILDICTPLISMTTKAFEDGNIDLEQEQLSTDMEIVFSLMVAALHRYHGLEDEDICFLDAIQESDSED